MREVMETHNDDPSDFDEVDFYHLRHAAKRRPRELKSMLADFEEAPDRAELLSVADQRIGDLDAFLNNDKWHTNTHGNRVLKGAGWTLTVFEDKDHWNWSIAGDPSVVLAALAGGQPAGEASGKHNQKSLFGPRHLFSQTDATDNLWLFLRDSAAAAASS